MSNKRQIISTSIVNGLYFVAIFAIALVFTSLGLARRLNTYDANSTEVFLEVRKNEISVFHNISGQIKEIFVNDGQGVRKGDLLVTLEDELSTAKIASLERNAATNVSARTEAELLKSQQGFYQIYAPDDGVVYDIRATEGGFLGSSTEIMKLYSDSDVKLSGEFSVSEYEEIASRRGLDIYSDRLEQIFEVTFYGVSQVINEPGLPTKYELLFSFVEPDDAAAFIQGEKVAIVSKSRDSDIGRPEQLVTKFWNSFILGPQAINEK